MIQLRRPLHSHFTVFMGARAAVFTLTYMTLYHVRARSLSNFMSSFH